MKDLESLIGVHKNVEPRRDVTRDFSDRVMANVRTPRGNWVLRRIASTRKGLHMHKMTKPAVLFGSLGIALITTVTGLAAAKWVQPDVSLDTAQGITKLQNGDQRFWVDYTSCPSQAVNTGTKAYYEIKAGSKLTPDQLVQGLLASCDSNELPTYFPQAFSTSQSKGQTAAFTAYEDQYYTPIVTVESTGKDNMTIDTGLNGVTYKNVVVPVDANATFYSQGKQIALSDLKQGDVIDAVMHTSALAQSYNDGDVTPDQATVLSKNGLAIGSSIAGGVKYEANHWQTMDQIFAEQGTDWTQLKADSSAPDGWTQIVPLNN